MAVHTIALKAYCTRVQHRPQRRLSPSRRLSILLHAARRGGCLPFALSRGGCLTFALSADDVTETGRVSTEVCPRLSKMVWWVDDVRRPMAWITGLRITAGP